MDKLKRWVKILTHPAMVSWIALMTLMIYSMIKSGNYFWIGLFLLIWNLLIWQPDRTKEKKNDK